jgi:putative endonuclease
MSHLLGSRGAAEARGGAENLAIEPEPDPRLRRPGLDPGQGLFFSLDHMKGGWVYLMSNRYRGGLYSGVTADLPARIHTHREGRGSAHVREHGLFHLVWAESFPTIDEAIAFEKRLKRWRRTWKFALIERANPDWDDLYPSLIG